jgi:DNA polymerase I-like protein with 3'-5' exonuclease and polymerase domains
MNGVTRDELLLTNVVLCTNPKGQTEVPKEAIKACAPRLHEELSGVDHVIACGREAVNLLVGRGSIDRYRGYIIEQPGRTVVAANNPALVLHDDATFPNLKRDFRRAFHPLPPPTYPTVEVIEDDKEVLDYLKDLQGFRGSLACDIESRGGLTHKATLICMQFSTNGTHAVVLGERGSAWERPDVIASLNEVLRDKERRHFIWHGGKFDVKILRHTYACDARVDEDTMMQSYALDERSGGDEHIGVHGLKYLLMDTFGWEQFESEAVTHAKKTGVVEDYDEFYRYAGLDAGGTFQLYEHQKPLVEADGVRRPYDHLLLRGTELAIDIELHGMVYDTDRAGDLYEFEVEPEMRELMGEMRQAVDKPMLNPRSPQQMSGIIYDDFGAQHALRKRDGMERSVDDSARKEILEDRFELGQRWEQVQVGTSVRVIEREDYKRRKSTLKSFIEKYDRYQSVQKQASTYLLGMIVRAELDPDSRIYTQLNFHGTNSGRLSSSKPNLQNITRSKEGLPDIRKLFRASPGRTLVHADFSQAELRCIAQFSGDKELNRIYREDLSLHKETATRFYGDGYTPEQYVTCKSVNFGAFYRQSAETFQEKHGINVDEARKYIEWLWKTFKGVGDWEREVEKEIHKGPLVSSFGRKRRFYLIMDSNRQAVYREGINFYPQSTASDLTLCAAIRLHEESDPKRCNIGILVHDSITSDVDEDYAQEYAALMVQIMEQTAYDELKWDMPFKAEVGIGPTWGETK